MRVRVRGYSHFVNLRRGDPRRIVVVAILIAGAAAWAWHQADEAADVLRFAAGSGAGLMLAGLMRIGDDAIAGRLAADVRDSLARTITIAGAAIVPGALLLARGIDLGDDLGVLLAGAAAGMFAGVAALYPLPGAVADARGRSRR